MTPAEKARAYLARATNPDGSLGHLAGQPGHLEPTLLACAARALAPPRAWLAAQPWGWGHLLLPACLADGSDLVAQTVDTILSLEGERVEDAKGWLGFDATIPAWPWIDQTAPWVEPTAYALLSLKRSGHGGSPRVSQGEALLQDRQCTDGGWNYGNPKVLGAELESYLPPTGWATLALPAGPTVDRALQRLQAARSQRSTSTLSLAILAHLQHGRDDVGALVELLVARQRQDGSFSGRCDWTALAACALSAADGGPHPFEVTT